MMDPISIIGLIENIIDITTALYQYGKDVKESKSQIAELLRELSMLQHVLEHIQERRKEVDEVDEQFNDFITSAKFRQITEESMTFVATLADDLGAKRNKFQRTIHALKWPFTGKEIAQRLEWLKRANSWYTLAMLADTSTNLDHVLVDLHKIQDDLDEDRKERRQYNNAREHSEMSEKVFQAFAVVDYETIHRKACKKWLPETGTWFLEGTFRDWYTDLNTSQQVMWVHGRSGAGKTTIFAQAVQRAMTHAATYSDIHVAYFYCTSAEAKSQEPKVVLSSWITQLADNINDFPERFSEHIKKHKDVPIDELIAAFRDTADRESSERFLLFVDAMNESKEAKTIIDTLVQVLAGHPNIRLLATCTLELEPTEFEAKVSVCKVQIGQSNSEKDIERYVEWKISDSPVLSSVSVELRDEIFRVLIKHAHGMFRWVQCQLDFLASQRSGRAVRQKLYELPDDLNQTYIAMLKRTALSEDDMSLVQKAFVWLCYSRRPLSLVELCEAISIEADMRSMNADDRLQDGKAIVRLCSGLIILDEETGFVTFAHDSVRQFLTSKQIRSTGAAKFAVDARIANTVIIRKCLTYLCFEDFGPGFLHDDDRVEELKREFPFLSYASDHWTRHYRWLPAQDSVTQSQLAQFLLSYTMPGSGYFGFWLQVMVPWYSHDMKRSVASSQPLYYAASFGLIDIVRWLLDSGLVKAHATGDVMDIDARGGRGNSTALQVACYRNYPDVAALLLEHGADPETRDVSGTRPMRYAQWQGDTEIIKILEKSIALKHGRRSWYPF